MANKSTTVRLNRHNELTAQQHETDSQILGFSIGVISLSAAIVSLFIGHEIAASIIGGSTVVGLVAVFVTGRFKKDASSAPQAPEG